jgi:hypothetical protein
MLPKDENGDVIVAYREQLSLPSFYGRDRADAEENVRTDAQGGKVSHASIANAETALQDHARRPAPAASDFQIARLMGADPNWEAGLPSVACNILW